MKFASFQATKLGADKIALRFLGRSKSISDPTGLVWRVLGHARSASSMEDLGQRCVADGISNGLTVVEQLGTAGILPPLVPEASDRLSQHLSRNHDLFGPMLGQKFSDIRYRSVLLEGVGEIRDAAQTLLATLGYSIASLPAIDWTSTKSAEFLGLCCHDWDDFSSIRKTNSEFVTKGIPFVSVWVDFPNIHVGPFVVPGATACFECYLAHLRRNVRHLAEFDARSEPEAESISLDFGPGSLAANWAASQGATVIALAMHGLGLPTKPAEILTTNLETTETTVDIVIPVPGCPVCDA